MAADRSWQQTHLEHLSECLKDLVALPEGIFYEEISGRHHIRLIKQSGQIQFFLVDPGSGELDGPMSRLDPARPLYLLAEYTQAAMLALLWNPQPKRICLLGLAGGRLALLFYHYFPHARIDNVDVDPAAAEIAASFFGLTFDHRQTITINDARAYIQSTSDRLYDIIIMDAFSDASDELDHLATVQFYAECKARMARGGVLCANILKSDPQFPAKVKTLLSSFRHTWGSDLQHGLVLFGSDDRKFSSPELQRRAALLQSRHSFQFPFAERATDIIPARELEDCSPQALREVTILVD